MKRILKKLLIISVVFLPVTFSAVSCSEDAPTYTNTTKDFVDEKTGTGKWGWETEQAEDLSDKFDVTIKMVSDTKITISNFHNLGADMDVTVDNSTKTVTFSGKLTDDYEVKAGTGTITNGYQQMNISYDIVDLNEDTANPEHIKAKLVKDNVLAKKAVAEN